MPTFAVELEQSLHRALALANEREHEYSTLEHLLLALTDDEDAKAVLEACGVPIEALKRLVTQYVDEELKGLKTNGTVDSKPTAGFQRVIQRAVIHVQSGGGEQVNAGNVLVAIFAERNSQAAHILTSFNVTRYDAINFISHGLRKGEKRRVKRNVAILSVSTNRRFNLWLELLLESAQIPSSIVLTDVAGNLNVSSTHTLAVVSPQSLDDRRFFKEVARRDSKSILSIVVDPKVSVGGHFRTLITDDVSATDAALEIFEFLGGCESFSSLDELFDAAVKRPLTKPDRQRSQRKNLPGEHDFSWQDGTIKPAPILPLDVPFGGAVLRPAEFLNDYRLLASEFAQQVADSNHTSYAKAQAYLLQSEIARGVQGWDPQTIDRRVRTIIALVMKDECPMNAIVQHNLREISDYQKVFRQAYPIVADRERAMRSFSVPDAIPLSDVVNLKEALQGSKIVAPEVVEKLDSVVEDIKIATDSIAADPRPNEAKKRATFSLAVMLNSISETLKNAPDLVRKLEAYKKLYEIAAPALRAIRDWISLFM